jgi:hypothetical protein
MNVVIKYLREFYSREFSWPYFLLIVAMLGSIIYFNYWHQMERRYAAGDGTWGRGFIGYYLLYFIPFAAAFALQLLFFKNTGYFSNPWFWAILLLAPAFFSFRVNFDFHLPLINRRWELPERIFYQRSISWVVRVFVLLVPVFIVWLIKDSNNQPFYGAKALTNNKPYLLMLLVMVPLIALASTQSDFLQTYPKAKALAAIPAEGLGGKLRYVVYELCYGFDFVSIEFFSAGF